MTSDLFTIGVAILFGIAVGAVFYGVVKAIGTLIAVRLIELWRGYRPVILWRRPEPPAERLAQLRAAAMASWEDSLTMGEGNMLSSVYAPMVVGLLDVASAATALLEADPEPAADAPIALRRKALRRALDSYLRDADYQRRQASWGRR